VNGKTGARRFCPISPVPGSICIHCVRMQTPCFLTSRSLALCVQQAAEEGERYGNGRFF